MSTQHDILIGRFWSHVFQSSENTAILLKMKSNGGSSQNEIAVPAIDWKHSGYAVASIMAYLRKEGISKGDRVAILAWNCPEWMWADLAIQSLGAVTVPIYPHSAADQVNFIVNNAKAKLVLSNEEEQLRKVTAAKAVHFDDIAPAVEPTTGYYPRKTFHMRFCSHPSLREYPLSLEYAAHWAPVKEELKTIEAALASNSPFLGVTQDDVATIIYTSGSTGVPKGVVLSHGNIAAACRSLTKHGFSHDPLVDVYISFLPAAHIYERVDGIAMAVWHGVPIGFCKIDELGDALKIFRPTLILGVPAVWRKMKERIESRLNATSGIKGCLIRWAMKVPNSGMQHWLAEKLVFKTIRAELGGRLRVMLSGGAPISADVLQFFRQIGLELLQGYGLTETTGGISTNRPIRAAGCRTCNKIGSVGPMVPEMEVFISPEPGRAPGEGEIWLRGSLIFLGYWELPEENAKAFSPDGWFKTGDLGRVDEDGFLYITGRKKRMLKSDGGKFLASEKAEKAFESDPIVQYVVPVGDGKPFFSGLIFLNQQVARERLGRPVPSGVDPMVYLSEQPEIIAAVQKAFETANAQLERWETLKKFRILPVEALVANGYLTPTLKIRTEEVLKHFAEAIESLYAKKS
ncbi:MAG: long-chain fatty acid--CoA ligase [Candidatus Obscuribacterales bacterium]|nr:long-chain fatty acid--CoA ligase [Candidatus Obscuribacterales bacterium]